MTLFAEASEAEKWVGPVLTTLGATVATLFAYLTGRDKLRFDTERIQMKADIAYLTVRVNECQAERDTLKEEVDELRLLMFRKPE